MQARGYYGFWTGEWKPGRVPYPERIQIKNAEYEKFLKEKEEYQNIMSNRAYYEGLITTNDIEIYEEMKKLLKSKSRSIDNKIAGYGKLKDDLRKILVEPVQRETAMHTTEKIPPSVLLYGPVGCGKSELAKAIVDETGCRVDIMPQDTTPRSFLYKLLNARFEARDNYISTTFDNEETLKNTDFSNGKKAEILVNSPSPRTIYIIDEIDKYLYPANESEQAEELAEKNKVLLKGFLDHCSDNAIRGDSPEKAGMTLIFTTNFPTKVDSEISLRSGKCTRIPVDIPTEKDAVDIIKFYLDKQNKRIEEEIAQGKDLKRLDISEFPVNGLAALTKPDKEKGVMSGAGIEKAIDEAVSDYILDPSVSVNLSLVNLLRSAKYRITPQKIEQYQKEIDAMGKTYSDIDEPEEYELLRELKELHMINPQQSQRLEALSDVYDSGDKQD